MVLRGRIGVVLHGAVVVVVPYAVEGGLDGDQDAECYQDEVFDQVDNQVPPLRTLPAMIAGLEESHGWWRL